MSTQVKYVPTYFAPDADPSWEVNPGVLVDVQNMVPTTRGTLVNYCCTVGEKYEPVADFTLSGGVDAPLSSRIMRRISGVSSLSARMFIGSILKLQEVNATTIVDVTRAAGGDYSAEDWTWDNFGDTMLACSYVGTGIPNTKPQASTGTTGTAFADVDASAPRANIIVTQKNFLLCFGVGDGATTYADGWMCSGLGNLASWTTIGGAANLATQANNGRLLETNGPITAAVVQRDYVVAYKRDSMYIGQYTGNPYTWSWRLVSDQVGQFSPSGTAVVEGVHYFLHSSGVYMFDGSQPVNIGTGAVNRFMESRMGSGANWDSPIRAVVDEQNSIIYWFFYSYEGREYNEPSFVGATAALAYNYRSRQFGFVSRLWSDGNGSMPIPVVATRGELRAWQLASTSNIRKEVASIWTVGTTNGTTMHIRHSKLGDRSEDNTTTYSRVVTGDIGNDAAFTKLLRIKPALVLGDDNLTASTCYVDSKATKGDYYTGCGVTLYATATGTGSGSAVGTYMRTSFAGNAHTVASGDYLAFDLLPIAGSLTTPVGIRVLCTDATTLDCTVNPTALGTAQSVLVSLASLVGKIIGDASAFRPMFGVPAATGLHHAIIRNVRITDSTGVLRRRGSIGNETRSTGSSTVTNYDAITTYPLDSYGTAYTYDTTRRRWDGTKSNRWHRARITLANQAELSGLYIGAEPAGSE